MTAHILKVAFWLILPLETCFSRPDYVIVIGYRFDSLSILIGSTAYQWDYIHANELCAQMFVCVGGVSSLCCVISVGVIIFKKVTYYIHDTEQFC